MRNVIALFYFVGSENPCIYSVPNRKQSYAEYAALLMSKLSESDRYFYSIRRLREKVFGYYNVGTDLFNGEYCGNTIFGAANMPIPLLNNQNVGIKIKNLSVIAGKLAAFFECKAFVPYLYDDKSVD